MNAGALDHLKEGSVPLVSATASVDNGGICVSLTNRSFSDSVEVQLDIRGPVGKEGTIRSLMADSPDAVNSADMPDRVHTIESTVQTDVLVLPPCSIHTLTYLNA